MRKLLLLALALFSMSACVLDSDEEKTTDYDSQLLQAGEEAPDFTIINDQYPEGLQFSSLRGKYVVLEFWASWCPDCRGVTSSVVDLYKTYASDSVVFVGVSFDTDKDTWQNYISANGMNWIQYSELKKWKNGTVIDTPYKVQWIPTFYLVGKDGRIISGTVDVEKLRSSLSLTLPKGEGN